MSVDYSSRNNRDRNERRRDRDRSRDRETPKWWILFESKPALTGGFQFGVVAKKGQINCDAEANSWDSLDAAEAEAKRLSGENPETMFLVVQARSCFHSRTTVRTEVRQF